MRALSFDFNNPYRLQTFKLSSPPRDFHSLNIPQLITYSGRKRYQFSVLQRLQVGPHVSNAGSKGFVSLRCRYRVFTIRARIKGHFMALCVEVNLLDNPGAVINLSANAETNDQRIRVSAPKIALPSGCPSQVGGTPRAPLPSQALKFPSGPCAVHDLLWGDWVLDAQGILRISKYKYGSVSGNKFPFNPTSTNSQPQTTPRNPLDST